MVLNVSRQARFHTVRIFAGLVYVADFNLGALGHLAVRRVDVCAPNSTPKGLQRISHPLGPAIRTLPDMGLCAIGMGHPRWRCPEPDWI
jgi:hypothetical protein